MTSLHIAKVGALSFVGLIVVSLAGFAVINILDEDLSPEVAILRASVIRPAPDENNSYIYLLGLMAPENTSQYAWGLQVLEKYRAMDTPGSDQSAIQESINSAVTHHITPKDVSWCDLSASESCLIRLDRKPELLSLRNKYALYLQRYRTLLTKHEYIELYVPSYIDSPSISYGDLISVNWISLLDIADKLRSGKVEVALRDMENEVTFHRRMLTGAQHLISKMVAYALLERDAFFISTWLGSHPGLSSQNRAVIKRMFAPLSDSEIDISTAWQAETRTLLVSLPRKNQQEVANWMSESLYIGSNFPLRDFIWMLGYRPHATANLYLGVYKIGLGLLASHPDSFMPAIKTASVQYAELTDSSPFFVNPTGKSLLDTYALGAGLSDYLARMYDLRGLFALVVIQNELGAGDLHPTQVKVGTLLAGDAGKFCCDPYTGKPMNIDTATRMIFFEPHGNGRLMEVMKTNSGGRVSIQY